MKKTLYIFQDGQLHRKDNSLYFESDNRRKFIPVENTNDIYLFGEVEISKRFLEFAVQKQICVHYFDECGKYIGTFYPREHYNAGYVIVKQVEHYIDKNRRIILAKCFAGGYTGQVIRVLKYYDARISREGDKTLKEIIAQIVGYQNNIQNASTNEEIITIIQDINKKYYMTFNYILGAFDLYGYKENNYEHLKNAVNVLVEFGDGICQTTVLSEIYKTYLDPRIGYLHVTDFNRFVLNVDVSYIFKPIMIDRLIFTLVNKKMITKQDFIKKNNKLVLSKDGRKVFIKEFDRRMRTTVNHRNLGRSVSYRRLIRLELYKIQKHILEEQEYKPYQSFW